jgi:hypothetical protein
MSPKSPNVGVVDFGEEEVRPQPRDTGKRKFLVFLRAFASRKLGVGRTDIMQAMGINTRWN